MGNLICRCGALLSTGNETSPYNADFLPTMSVDKWDDAQREQLHTLIAAMRGGKSVAEFLEITSSDTIVVEALLLWKVGGEPFFNLSRELLQCHACGRLLVKTNQRHNFRTFLPETDDTLGILAAE